MRLVTFESAHGDTAGIVAEDRVLSLGVPIEEILREPRHRWRAWSPEEASGIRLDDVILKAPVPKPGKIIAFGMNYRDHCLEQGIDPPTEPLVFAKFPSSVIGPGASVSWPADVTQVDWEVELAIVVGAAADRDGGQTREVDIAGYTIANDVSARDLQARDGQFVRAKSLDTFCPLGPYLVTRDEVPDPVHLDLSMHVNGVQMQQSNTNQLLFGVPELFAFCRRYFSLEPGDIILTGTPPGVGVFRSPPIFLAAGDVMVAAIEGLGELRTPVAGGRAA